MCKEDYCIFIKDLFSPNNCQPFSSEKLYVKTLACLSQWHKLLIYEQMVKSSPWFKNTLCTTNSALLSPEISEQKNAFRCLYCLWKYVYLL